MIWGLVLIFLVSALVFLLRPLLVPPSDLSQGIEETAYFKSQINDVAADMAVGALAETEAAIATTEAQRRWKASVRYANKKQTPVDDPKSKMAAMICLAIAPLAALGFYASLGNPGLSVEKIAYETSATAPQREAPSLKAAIAQLQEHLTENPEDAEGWRLLGESFQSAGEYQFALTAFIKASDLLPEQASLMAAQAEVVILLAQGVVEEEALVLLKRTLAMDKTEPRAQFYLASYLYQQGQKQQALEALQQLDGQTEEGAIWQATVKAKISDISSELGLNSPVKGPTSAQVNAAEAMTDAQRQSMIAGMIGTLESRLAEQPDDLDGWLMLARSYSVLGNSDKSAVAYERAMKLAPTDIKVKSDYMEMLLTEWQAPEANVPERAEALATVILTTHPDHPFALFIAGAAAQSKNPDQARRHWQKLADIMPEVSPQRAELQALIESLD